LEAVTRFYCDTRYSDAGVKGLDAQCVGE